MTVHDLHEGLDQAGAILQCQDATSQMEISITKTGTWAETLCQDSV